MGIEVVNKYKIKPQIGDVYIGRGSPLGNPFPIQGKDTRKVVIQKYRDWLDNQLMANNTSVITALDDIARSYKNGGNVRLVCFCKPQDCHGDYIREVILEALENENG